MLTDTGVRHSLLQKQMVITGVISMGTTTSAREKQMHSVASAAVAVAALAKISHTRTMLTDTVVRHSLLQKQMVITGVISMGTTTSAREKQMRSVASAAVAATAATPLPVQVTVKMTRRMTSVTEIAARTVWGVRTRATAIWTTHARRVHVRVLMSALELPHLTALSQALVEVPYQLTPVSTPTMVFVMNLHSARLAQIHLIAPRTATVKIQIQVRA